MIQNADYKLEYTIVKTNSNVFRTESIISDDQNKSKRCLRIQLCIAKLKYSLTLYNMENWYNNEEMDLIQEAVKYFIQNWWIESRDREDEKFDIKIRDLYIKISSEIRW